MSKKIKRTVKDLYNESFRLMRMSENNQRVHSPYGQYSRDAVDSYWYRTCEFSGWQNPWRRDYFDKQRTARFPQLAYLSNDIPF